MTTALRDKIRAVWPEYADYHDISEPADVARANTAALVDLSVTLTYHFFSLRSWPADELEQLPAGTVVIDVDGDLWTRGRDGWQCNDVTEEPWTSGTVAEWGPHLITRLPTCLANPPAAA